MIHTILSMVFWLLLFIVFYTYIGYGIVVWALVHIRQLLGKHHPVPDDPTFLPAVTLVIPAYNEIDYVKEKIKNSYALNYPAHLLHILLVTEGSNDGTTEYVQQISQVNGQVKGLGGLVRRGKVEAINVAMEQIKTAIVIFTDANTMLNVDSVKLIVRHFKDEKVGAVSGEKRIKTVDTDSVAGSGEGLYWKYESFLKKLDTQLYSVVGAAGELFAIRTSLYEPVEKDTLLDDFIISLRIAEQGYRVIYEPDAYASERPSHSIGDEQKRKVRIAAGGFQAINRLRRLNNVFRYGWLSFQYISHRVLRWAVTPFLLPAIVVINALLLLFTDGNEQLFYAFFLLGQLTFYGAALLGHYFESRNVRVKALFVPYYFSFMNWCAILGYNRYRAGIVSGAWEKSRRAK
jgi:cellulose synthase/poly-beta-1,6-N-acetylglucosamine synthase-like glycosyltransferase